MNFISPRRLLFRSFYAVYRLDRWFRQRFTDTGLLLLSMSVIAGVFSINTRATLSYQLVTLCVSVVGLSMLCAIGFRARVAVRRQLPRYATVDQTVHYSIWMTNQGTRGLNGMALEERLTARPPSLESFRRGAGREGRKRNWFDRRVGYHRWASMLSKDRGVRAQAQALGDIPAKENLRVDMRLTPLRRGYVRLHELVLTRVDPLGLFKAQVRVYEDRTLLALPKTYPVQWSELLGKSQDRIGGVNEASTIGGSEEFAALREYRPGDSLRHISWKTWTRFGYPVVKEFHDECFVRQALILDTFADQYAAAEHFEAAVSVAASFALSAPTSRGVLDLMFMGTDAYHFSAGPGLGGTDRLLEVLACVDICREQDFASLRESVMQRLDEVNACVCVLLSWDQIRQDLVKALRQLDIGVLVIVVADAGDDLPVDPGPLADQPDRFHAMAYSDIARELTRRFGGGRLVFAEAPNADTAASVKGEILVRHAS